jgi:amidophosphoribosyltransferase
MCGFVGIIGPDAVARSLILGLYALQHRGQDAAGIGTLHRGALKVRKSLGLVSQALADAADVPGNAGIGHVRYPTSGSSSNAADAQPFITRRPGMLLAHNGNITNVPELTDLLRVRGVHVQSQCDAEPVLLLLADALIKIRPAGHTTEDLTRAVGEVFDKVRGAYSVVAVLEVDGEDTLVAFRDPHGIRPGVYGQREDGTWIVASESVALDVLSAGDAKNPVHQMPPGGLLLLRHGKPEQRVDIQTRTPSPCVFERIYFARPDSLMGEGRVLSTRWQLGRVLARQIRARGIEVDVVVAVPDTSRPAAMAIAEDLGVENREGFIKNRYSGRTFIMPDDASRNAALRLKLNPIPEFFRGKRVLLVDDSIVRGNTMRRIVRMVRDLEPTSIHLAIFSPPVLNPCFYGIDMPSSDELIAARMTPDQLATYFAADSLTYLSEDGLDAVFGPAACTACFTGRYPVEVSKAERASITADRRPVG